MLGAKNWPKKYNIDYFGYAVNLEFKFKLNFDEEGDQKFMELQLNQLTC
jgi:hypothetical protein